MRTETKTRLALLSTLLIVGVLIAGLGTVLGVKEVMAEITPGPEEIVLEAVDADGTTTVTVSQDGEIAGSLTAWKGEVSSADGSAASAAIPGNCDLSGGETKSSKS